MTSSLSQTFIKQTYIYLRPATEENDPDASQNTDGDGEIGESEFPPMYDILHGDDDPDAAVEHKTRATDLLASGDTGGALESLNLAVLASDPSPSLLTLRAKTLMSVNRHRAADRDASSALAINPDSARALRVRGRNRMKMLEWLGARSDLSAAQGIDFDEIVADDLKEAVAQVKKIEGERVKDKLEVCMCVLLDIVISARDSFAPTVRKSMCQFIIGIFICFFSLLLTEKE